MAYIGNNSTVSNIQKIDAVTFNSSTTTFDIRVNGGLVVVGSSTSMIISVGGVIQEPNVDYTVAGSSIIFSTAPLTGLSFFGVILGASVNIGTPSDNTVTNAKISEAVSIAKGGTGATTADAALTNLGGGAAGKAVFTSSTQANARTQLGLGTAAVLNAGTSTGDLVQLVTGNKLPSVDGSNLTGLSSGFSNITVFTTSGTFMIPAGITKCKVTVVGGGGGGATAAQSGGNNYGGSGGGAGGAAIRYLSGLTPANTLAVTVGTGGAATTAGVASSVASGTQTITTITANGGGAGVANSYGGTGGTATGGTLNITGGEGSPGLVGWSSNNASGTGGVGGASIFGTGGSGATGSGAGRAATVYGSGGGGAVNSTGGAGAGGIVIFEF